MITPIITTPRLKLAMEAVKILEVNKSKASTKLNLKMKK